MRYNELTYHKASPFFRQDFLPDRAWYNRKPKEFPSQIPTGQEYFDYSGRRHFNSQFNHSEIESKGVLTSPEKYPFQNRIAQDKTYQRQLDTTDIEGAASGTRVNPAVRNRLRAQEQIARKYNQSLDMSEHKEHQYEEKRRDLAARHMETLKGREEVLRERKRTEEAMNSSRISNYNPERQREKEGDCSYQEYMPQGNGNGSKYVSLLPKPYYAHLEQNGNQPQLINRYLEPGNGNGSNHDNHNNNYNNYNGNPTKQPENNNISTSQHSAQPEPQESHRTLEPEELPPRPTNPNDRHKSNPQYISNYEQQLQRRKEDYARTIQIDQVTRDRIQDKKELRKYNPTNLSFNLAAQTIVAKPY